MMWDTHLSRYSTALTLHMVLHWKDIEQLVELRLGLRPGALKTKLDVRAKILVKLFSECCLVASKPKLLLEEEALSGGLDILGSRFFVVGQRLSPGRVAVVVTVVAATYCAVGVVCGGQSAFQFRVLVCQLIALNLYLSESLLKCRSKSAHCSE